MKLSICSLLVSSLSHLPRYGRATCLSESSPRQWAIRGLVILMMLAACPRPLMAQCEEDQILPFDGVPGDGFGKSVAIDGNLAIIGTEYDDNVRRPGAAYIYRFDGVSWNLEANLQPDDVEDYDFFGSAVSIHGDVAVVGSHADDNIGDNSGSAYVFRFNGKEWIEDGLLLAPDGDNYDHFGLSVDIHGDYIAIGAPWADTTHLYAGVVYLYHYGEQGWEFIQKFDSSSYSFHAMRFGYTLAIDEQFLVIGSRTFSTITWTGEAFVYQLIDGEWIPITLLRPFDLEIDARFGSAVDIDGDTIAVSAPNMRSIYIYTFEENQWTQRQRIYAPEFSRDLNPDSNISLKDDLLVTGGSGYAIRNGFASLFAFLYRYDAGQSLQEPWAFERVLAASDPTAKPSEAVATNGQIIMAGHWTQRHNDDDWTGAVYVFQPETDTRDCNANFLNDVCDIISGLDPDCNNNGIPDSCDLADGLDQDCNENDIPDLCDIASGESQDCNGNNQPDDCELDCNGNAIPDECEIAAETAFDGNGNGLLDECDCPVRFRILPEEHSDRLGYGESVDISQDVAIVGSTLSHGAEMYTGAAFIYRRINGVWTQEAKIFASDGESGDRFGKEVAIDGNTAAVSMEYIGNYDDAVYIFQYQEESGRWEEKQIIPRPGEFETFGIDVALSRNRLAVLHLGGAGLYGTVVSIYKYVEDDDIWEFEDQVQVARGSALWSPQSNLELQGDLLIAGTAGYIDNSAATITIHRRHEEPDGTSRWVMEAKLTSPDSKAHDFYGLSCAIDGNIAVVGALQNENNNFKTGAAYIYEYDGESWQYTKKLLPDRLDGYRWFGLTTAVKHNVVMISSIADGTNGSLYRFQRILNDDHTTKWEPITKVHFFNALKSEFVGWKMEADGDFAIVSSKSWLSSRDWESAIHFVNGIQDSDRDGFSDMCDTCPATPNLDLSDSDGDGLGDACDVFGDVNNDGLINVTDLLQMLAAWGFCPDDGLPCLADLDRDGSINVTDLLLLLLAW